MKRTTIFILRISPRYRKKIYHILRLSSGYHEVFKIHKSDIIYYLRLYNLYLYFYDGKKPGTTFFFIKFLITLVVTNKTESRA